MTTYFEGYKTAQIRADMLADHLRRAEQQYVDLMVRLESLSIKWGKYGTTLMGMDDVLEEFEETYK